MRICMDFQGDLDLSLYPSFLSALYGWVDKGVWVKLVGYGRGHRLYARHGRLCCEGPGCSTELLAGIAGEWCRGCRPEEGSKIPGFLKEMSGKLVISALHYDRLLVAFTVFLSRRTSYVSNVVRWVRTVFDERVVDPRTGKVDVERAVRRLSVFTSYQVQQLASTIHVLAEIMEAEKDAWKLRTKLLSVRNSGPKTTDATLLFGAYTSLVAPADTHLEKTAKTLGLTLQRPSKNTCLRQGAVCTQCPLSNRCLSGYFVEKYGGIAGWVQTASYVYWTLQGKNLHTVLRRFFWYRRIPIH